MLKLLQGIRILDFTTTVSGPYATRLLGDLGADIVKVEPPGGDPYRGAGPGRSPGMGAAFLETNRNKRSIMLDLKQPRARMLVRRMAAQADAVVHNMRAASADRLGIGHAAMKEANPDIVYCSAPGFGRGGRSMALPAYDDIIQAASGLAMLNADAEGEPRFVRTILSDKVAGLHLALAVTAGLLARANGRAVAEIEVPMLETTISFLLLEHLQGATFEPSMGGMGYRRLLTPHRKPFRTADGHVAILPYTDGHWRRFLALVGRDDLLHDPRTATPAARSANVDMLYALIEDIAPRHTTGEWLTLLREQDIPCSPVNRMEDLLDEPHLGDVGLFRRFEHPSEGELVTVRSPIETVGVDAAPDRPVPLPGGDGATLLAALGLSEEEIAALVAEGAVILPVPLAG